MKSLSEYRPIKQIVLPPDVLLDNPHGLILVVGPNSSGKTRFLRDIESYFRTGELGHVVCRSITGEVPKVPQEFVQCLVDRKYLRLINERDYRVDVPQMGTEKFQRGSFSMDHIVHACTSFSPQNAKAIAPFFKLLGVTLISALPLDARKEVCVKSSRYNPKDQSPETPIQALFLSPDTQALLEEETSRVFANVAWLDLTDSKSLVLRTSGGPTSPDVRIRSDPSGLRREVEQEGDGYRSYL